MRKMFAPHYASRRNYSLSKIARDCHFALDTNFFLPIYQAPPERAQIILSILDALADRLFMPYQTAIEYHYHVQKTIAKQVREHTELLQCLQSAERTIKTPPFQPANAVLAPIQEAVRNVELLRRGELRRCFQIRDKVARYFKDRVMHPVALDVFAERCQAATFRYDQRIPPGFEDRAKKGAEGNAFGDALTWFELIDYAKEHGVSVVFVTGDRKKDWWLQKPNENRHSAHPELTAEFFARTGHNFYLFDNTEFIKLAPKALGIGAERRVIDEFVVELLAQRESLDEQGRAAKYASLMEVVKRKLADHEYEDAADIMEQASKLQQHEEQDDEERISLEQFFERNGITHTQGVEQRGRPDQPQPYDGENPPVSYRFELRRGNDAFELFGSVDDIRNALSELHSEAMDQEEFLELEDWRSEHGYAEDEPGLAEAHEYCVSQCNRLKEFLGENGYHDFFYMLDPDELDHDA